MINDKKSSKEKILIVDDSQENVDLLIEILENRYELSIAVNGLSALQKIPQFLPDLILLDITMPVMDGYEFLENIKKESKYNDIYIMVLTNISKSEDVIRAIELGANHYLTKPFNPDEINAWVKTLTQKKKAEDLLKKSISILEHDAALGVQTSGFAHDLGNILNSLLCYKMIENDLNNIEDLVDQESRKRIKKYIKSIRNTCLDIQNSINLGGLICSNMMLYSDSCYSDLKLLDLKEILVTPLSIYKRHMRSNNIELLIDFEPTPLIRCKNCEIQRVLLNLISNAIHAMENSLKKELKIKLSKKDNKWVKLTISDTGHGIPKELQSKVFERFFTTKKRGNGIGLDTVKKIIESHEGNISLTSEEKYGTKITILFPIPLT